MRSVPKICNIKEDNLSNCRTTQQHGTKKLGIVIAWKLDFKYLVNRRKQLKFQPIHCSKAIFIFKCITMDIEKPNDFIPWPSSCPGWSIACSQGPGGCSSWGKPTVAWCTRHEKPPSCRRLRQARQRASLACESLSFGHCEEFELSVWEMYEEGRRVNS